MPDHQGYWAPLVHVAPEILTPEVLCGCTGPPSQGLGPLSSRSWIARFSPATDYSRNRQAGGIPEPQRKGGVQTHRHSPAQLSGGRGGRTHEPLGEHSSPPGGEVGPLHSVRCQEHVGTRVSAACRDVQSPASPGETQVKPRAGTVLRAFGCAGLSGCNTSGRLSGTVGASVQTDTQVCTQAHAHRQHVRACEGQSVLRPPVHSPSGPAARLVKAPAQG